MNIKTLLNYSVLIVILSSLFLINSSFAETKIFIREYTYHAGDEDSRNSSRTIALREVKRLLLEELGTYLESQTEVKNFQMTRDQITTLTAGIVSTEIIEDTWDGKAYWLKAKIAANPQDVIKSVDSLRKDREKVKELEELRKRSEELLRENERLNKELKIAKGDTKQELAQAYRQNIDNLSAMEWFEKGYELAISPDNQADAVKAFSKAIELNPQYANAYFHRGVAYMNLSNYQQAINDFNKDIELIPRDLYAYFFRGYTFGKIGNYQQAIKDYNKAIEMNPQFSLAYINRGIAYTSLDNYQQALNDYNKGIELDPQYAEAYFLRGLVYVILKNYQMEFWNFNKAIELNPQDAKAYFYRGRAYVSLGNDKQAIKDFNKAIELNPQYADAYVNRGVTYGKLGNYQQQIKDLKIAARLDHKKSQDFLKSKGIVW